MWYEIIMLMALATIISISLGLSTLRRSRELRKARLFLRFELYDRMTSVIGFIAMGMIAFQMVYITFHEKEAVSLRMPYALYNLLIYVILITIFLTMYHTYKDVGKK